MIELTKEIIVTDIKDNLNIKSTVVAALTILIAPAIFLVFCKDNELGFLSNLCAYVTLVILPISMGALAFVEIIENKRIIKLIRQLNMFIYRTKIIQLSSNSKKNILVKLNGKEKTFKVSETAYRTLKPGDEIFVIPLKSIVNSFSQALIYQANKYVLNVELSRCIICSD